jgi:hypothetical protein
MRITVERPLAPPSPAGHGVAPGGPQPTTPPKKNVTFGREDLLLVFVVALILSGLLLGKVTFDQALAYIGVSTSGGVWGLISGRASD